MIAVLQRKKNCRKLDTKKYPEIITVKYVEKTIYNEDGSLTIKRIPEKVNITRKVNESKKLIKTYTDEEKMAEIERITRS